MHNILYYALQFQQVGYKDAGDEVLYSKLKTVRFAKTHEMTV